MPVAPLDPASIRSAMAGSAPGWAANAHAYALLKGICATAVHDDLLAANPGRVRGAGQAKRASRTEPATLDELAVIVDAMPQRYRLMVLLAAWCAMRFGELIELRRSDVDVKAGVVRVRRAVVWVDGTAVVGKPKSDAGVRDVAIPPHVLPAVRVNTRPRPARTRRSSRATYPDAPEWQRGTSARADLPCHRPRPAPSMGTW